MEPLAVMIKPASGLCNMKCAYCFYRDEMKKRERGSLGFMSEETLKNVIRKTLPRAKESIYYIFQGGEPTLRGISDRSVIRRDQGDPRCLQTGCRRRRLF